MKVFSTSFPSQNKLGDSNGLINKNKAITTTFKLSIAIFSTTKFCSQFYIENCFPKPKETN